MQKKNININLPQCLSHTGDTIDSMRSNLLNMSSSINSSSSSPQSALRVCPPLHHIKTALSTTEPPRIDLLFDAVLSSAIRQDSKEDYGSILPSNLSAAQAQSKKVLQALKNRFENDYKVAQPGSQRPEGKAVAKEAPSPLDLPKLAAAIALVQNLRTTFGGPQDTLGRFEVSGVEWSGVEWSGVEWSGVE